MNASDQLLAQARAELDDIDDQMLDLLDRRLAVASRIAQAKQADGLLKLRPRRQAEVLARLQRRARRASPAAVAAVWREVMSHALHEQAGMRVLLAAGLPEHAPKLVRDLFGSAPSVEIVAGAGQALDAAMRDEAIAILPLPLAPLPAGLRVVQVLDDGAGVPLAVAVGRISPDEEPEAAARLLWSPGSWRSRQAAQMPIYPDAARLGEVEAQLAAAAPVVEIDGAAELRRQLAAVARGDGFLVQGGDCAESFAACGAQRVSDDRAALLDLGKMVAQAAAAGRIVHVARIAGQFAKPRSSGTERRGDQSLPSYRGDAVNASLYSLGARMPDPQRLLQAYRHSAAAAGLIDALSRAEPGGRPATVWTSHEALLLHYEQGLTRRDPQTGRWWGLSGHMLWIGDRTRDLDGAHVDYASGIANAIGLKCGPGLDADTLLRLIDRLDPANEAGRLTLIARMGAAEVERCLPALMRATRREGREVIWSCDPMHGNGRAAGSRKTRHLDDILAETDRFFGVARAVGVRPGGIHLEMTGADVTECLGAGVAEEDLHRRYESLCDPRLNPAQARAVGALLRRELIRLHQPATRVA